MYDRKGIKEQARQTMKRHYVLLVVLCAVSIFLGTEFTNVTSNTQLWYDMLTGQTTLLDIPGVVADRAANDKLLSDIISDNQMLGQEEAARRMQALKASTDASSMLGRQRGVLAAVMNNINSGQFSVTLTLALHSIIHSKEVASIIMILGGLAVAALVWVFFRNVYRAILRRAFLELRTYEALPMGHLLYLKSVKRWAKASLTLLLASIYETLWQMTIVGGFIKRYSYFLVPFIVAENPDIPPRRAITLSRQMMNGHKWECFKLELSFLGWMVLGFVSFGALDVLWSVPYRMAAYSEYYTLLRSGARERALTGSEMLNDDYLYEVAGGSLLQAHYPDIVQRESLVDEDIVTLSPSQNKLVRRFGIWTATLYEKKVYSRQQGLRQQMRVGRLELEGKAYPQRLNLLWHREAAALTGKVSYLTPVTIWSLIIIFFAFNMVGWLWEVSLSYITEGTFVNRGMLHGPWLPIYGSGVAMIAVLLYRFRNRPMLEALTVVVLCGFVEYMTSWITELATGMRWWDYTGYFLNLNGRICGEGLAVFALGGMAAIYFLVPIIDGAVTRIRPRVLVPICIALLLCFAADMVYSHFNPNTGAGITDYKTQAPVEAAYASDASAWPEAL